LLAPWLCALGGIAVIAGVALALRRGIPKPDATQAQRPARNPL
jgi:hypothetical protein